MLKRHIKLALIHLRKNRSFTLINLIGLAISLAATLFIILYVESEYSYDKHWKDASQIYRISEEVTMQGKSQLYATTGYQMADELKEHFPQVEASTRLHYGHKPVLFHHEEKAIEIPGSYYADSCFFDVFNLNFISGNPHKALSAPESIVISESTANKFFGHSDVLGHFLKTDHTTFTITGIFKDIKKESHLNINTLRSASTYTKEKRDKWSRDWVWQITYTYLKMSPQSSLSQFKQQMDRWKKETIAPYIKTSELNMDINFHLLPIGDIHLKSPFSFDAPSNSSEKYQHILMWVALFLLLTSSINFINLTTSKSSLRSPEVGIRKTVGAHRSQLITQFLTESLFITFLALLLAVALVILLLPLFNSISHKNFDIFWNLLHYQNYHIWIIIVSVGLITGLISGGFPAVVLSSYNPNVALKGGFLNSEKTLTQRVRKILVVVQLTLSITIIIATLMVRKQVDYMQSQQLGFAPQQVLVIHYPSSRRLLKQSESIKQEVMQIPGVTSVSLTKTLPSYHPDGNLFYFKRQGIEQQQMWTLVRCDANLLKTLDIPLLKGRFFSPGAPENQTNKLVVNEACVKYLQTDHPIGFKMVSYYAPQGEIIGVVKDFHFKSLQHSIEPTVFIYDNKLTRYMAIRFSSKNAKTTIDKILTKWKNFAPYNPLHYDFLDQHFAGLYQQEQHIFKLFTIFSSLILIIACMGLLGLTSFMAEKKRKEITIRKILGAKNRQLIATLGKEFIVGYIIANILAWTLCYLLIPQWLETFAYHSPLSISIFLLASLLAFILTGATVLLVSTQFINQNPAKNLKTE